MPSFVPDVPGNYTAILTVGDGLRTHKDSALLATAANLAPVARTGFDDVAMTLADDRVVGQSAADHGGGVQDADRSRA